jgi:ABC-type lipoprotein release transport system permease subunit
VGVVENILDWGKDADPQPAFYEPIERGGVLGMNFMVRGNADLDSLRTTAKRLGKETSPPWDLSQVYSVEAQLYASTAPRRIYMWLLTTMGALGLLLSALGVYAVMAYAVVRRTREIGVRMALGATRGNIARLILGRGGRLLLNGMVLGAMAAFSLAHYVESLLYQVKPGNPWTFLGVLLTLGAVAGIACYIPARRATRVNPMEALRYE